MNPTLTVHRGTREIGGSCIEIVSAGGERLILDVGRPLDAPADASDLLPSSLDRTRPATVIISHAHQDHHGLLSELPVDWPVWMGTASSRLIRMIDEIMGRPAFRLSEAWGASGDPFSIGAFRVTPILTDHSAFDAHMLLVEVDDRRILYSGDFRRHGRKGALLERLMAAPPTPLDVLIIEGTNLGTDKPVRSERDLEDDLVALFEATPGRVFVSWSGQNVDRTVTLYRAAKRTRRTLVIDLYTADVLDQIAEGTRLPRPGFPNLKVVVTRSLAANYRRRGRDDFVTRMAGDGVAVKNVPKNAVVMLRRGLMKDYEAGGLTPQPGDAFNFSAWKGYLDVPYYAEAVNWCRDAGAKIAFLHTSGHASAGDLRAFAAAMGARMVVPVHGANWDRESMGFANLRRLEDGERLVVTASESGDKGAAPC